MKLSTTEFIIGLVLIIVGYFGLFHLLGIKTTIFLFLIFTGITFMLESDTRRLSASLVHPTGRIIADKREQSSHKNFTIPKAKPSSSKDCFHPCCPFRNEDDKCEIDLFGDKDNCPYRESNPS